MCIVGHTQHSLSSVMFDIHSDLLESYKKVFPHLCNLSLKLFYESPLLSQVTDIVKKKRIHEGIRDHKRQFVDFQTVKQRHLLWHKLTSAIFLPFFLCKHILTIAHTYWNSMKHVGGYITQILWLRKFNPPRLSLQTCSTMKITFCIHHHQKLQVCSFLLCT